MKRVYVKHGFLWLVLIGDMAVSISAACDKTSAHAEVNAFAAHFLEVIKANSVVFEELKKIEQIEKISTGASTLEIMQGFQALRRNSAIKAELEKDPMLSKAAFDFIASVFNAKK